VGIGILEGALRAGIYGNIALNLVTGGSFQFLWSLINSMQILSLCPLITFEHPANSAMLFRTLANIMNFNILPTDETITSMLDLNDTETTHNNFQLMHYETAYVLLNISSIVYFLLGSVGMILFEWVLRALLLKY